MKKFLILAIFFYILAILETSFFIHFKFFSFLPNLILISQILITLFEKPYKTDALYSAILAGFFLDIFSEKPLGFNIITLFFITFFLKEILKRYVRI
ncbi:rod shape-determining protein MreD [bacterium]|nr:rod shape-determining protein MreD [bacterium]